MLYNITFRIRTEVLNEILSCGASGCRLKMAKRGFWVAESVTVSVKKTPSRRRVKMIPVPVLPSEKEAIQVHAAQCGLSVAAYLRNLGLQYRPKGILDYQAVTELAKVNGDLGRLGGLLKMLLSNDERFKEPGAESVLPKIQNLLDEIQATQGRLFDTAQRVG